MDYFFGKGGGRGLFPRSDWLDPCSHLFSSLQEFLLVWKQMPKSSFARFSSFARGRIVGRAEEGASTQSGVSLGIKVKK